MKKINFEEYKHRVNKKEVKQSLAKMANNLEKILFNGKEWAIVVLIPTIELLMSILSLIENHSNDHDDYDDFYY